VNSLTQPTAQTGLAADEYGMSQTAPNQFNGSFFGTRSGWSRTQKANGTFRSQLTAATNLAGKEIWVRVADVFGGTFPADATGFELGSSLVGR